MKKNVFVVICLVFFLLCIDLVIKYFVSSYLTNVTIIDNFFSLTYVLNSGAAFSFLASKPYILILIAFIALLFILYELKNNIGSMQHCVGYSLTLAGLLGNLFDRLGDGYIIDYLSFKIFGYNFPIFNFADIIIVFGIFIVIIKELRNEVF